MALVNIQVPDIGDFDEVGVIELLVKVGDTVKAEQSLITVESDKASMEIPSSHAGVVKELKVALGDKVKQGSVIAVVEAVGATAAAPAAAPAPAAPPQPPRLLQRPPCGRRTCASHRRPGGSARARHWRLQERGRDRAAGQARRHRGAGAIALHRRIRQSLDGDSFARRWRAQGTQGQDR